MESEQPVLPVERAQDPALLGELQDARVGATPAAGGRELEAAVGDEQDAAGDRGQCPRIGALQVVVDELFDLALDDRALERLLGGSDLLFEELPVDAPSGF